MKTIVTTAGRPSDEAIIRAKKIASDLQYDFQFRNKRSIKKIQELYKSAVLVVGNEKIDLYRIGMEKAFFFHPNSAAFRLKRLRDGGCDPLLEAAQLKAGDSFLDCTLGLASDSIIASSVVGESGKVMGIEGDQDIFFIVKDGLKNYETTSLHLQEAMDRIEVVFSDALSFLQSEDSNSWDVVYIDPMFSEPVKESNNFTPLRMVGLKKHLTEKWVNEAYRVCKRMVVIKDYFRSSSFRTFGFKQIVRPNTKFHFGYKLK